MLQYILQQVTSALRYLLTDHEVSTSSIHLLLLLVCEGFGPQVESLVSLGWCIRRGTRGQGDGDADYLPPQILEGGRSALSEGFFLTGFVTGIHKDSVRRCNLWFPSAGVFAEVLAGRATGTQITFPTTTKSH